jgi:predicted dehydrogenase
MARKVQVGQVGLGDWGKNLLRNFIGINSCEMIEACDSKDVARARVAEMFPGLAITDKYEDLLNDSALEAIIIATPPAYHYALAVQAIEAGKDVFVEKPLVLDLEQGKKLVALAEKNKRILMVGHIMLYHPASLLLKKYLDDGELGDIYYLYSQRINLGKVRDIENSLWSFAPHDISLMMFLLNKMPIRVNATGAAYLQKGVEDVCFITIQFEDKTLAHIHVSWLDPHKIRKLTIVGSKKMAVFTDTE